MLTSNIHFAYDWLTLPGQRVRLSYESGSLLNRDASNVVSTGLLPTTLPERAMCSNCYLKICDVDSSPSKFPERAMCSNCYPELQPFTSCRIVPFPQGVSGQFVPQHNIGADSIYFISYLKTIKSKRGEKGGEGTFLPTTKVMGFHDPLHSRRS
ncbi:hypothetical protein B0H22_10496 [Methanohalophilus euhalobius]|uniref:Uncharacterized protein n=1 Tax=Methanohalophilus euhalobius TaxID=51203 RepID=A0A315B9I2_9EURY|nr:hypothetical protein B0H22_10496 [Methanohalophilus euhalobius]